ncbi:hypothetical protein L4C37_10765 [Vibrio kagoshimensis]|uniref:hypothetical protein n=1 Tax=Vibrio kagoshimensis TaxID=2910244 RepID=UPI003D249845
MKVLSILFFLIAPALADDSEINPIAKKIKSQIVKSLDKSTMEYQGYCDVTIEMRHFDTRAKIHRVRTSGDRKLCKFAKKSVRIGKTYKYVFPEKFIRLHITQ